MDVTVLFPMAGRGERFGGVFKPFLRYSDELFLEAAVRPFRAWTSRIRRFGFVYLEEQEAVFHVRAELARRFAGLAFDAIQLDRPTRGPAETIARAVAQRRSPDPPWSATAITRSMSARCSRRRRRCARSRPSRSMANRSMRGRSPR